MARQVVILHGWSDDSSSFRSLASYLQREGFDTRPVLLGDYISLRDDVTIDDVAKRMEAVISARMALPEGHAERLDASFHLVVHSTGGLVARRWISRYYGANRRCPVKNLLMLAPANFGSKLAHKGRTLLGRAVKGWRTGFETGEEMLYALELGSPFLWDLALTDLFVRDGGPAVTPLYGPDRVRPFVITGTHPYDSYWARITNEDGSDGTVRVAAANLNARGATVDFTGDPERLLNPRFTPWPQRLDEGVRFPLAVLPDRDHSSVTNPDAAGFASGASARDRLGRLMVQALGCETAEEYQEIHDDWDAVTGETRTYAGSSPEAEAHRAGFFQKAGDVRPEFFHEHYQIFVRVVDEFGSPVPDYFLAFVATPKARTTFELQHDLPKTGAFFHSQVLRDVHVHRRAPGNRTLFLDRYRLMGRDGFYKEVGRSGGGHQRRELAFTITAADPGERVSYFSRQSGQRRGVVPIHVLHEDAAAATHGDLAYRWLQRHTTHFVEVVIPRAAVDRVFELRRHGS